MQLIVPKLVFFAVYSAMVWYEAPDNVSQLFLRVLFAHVSEAIREQLHEKREGSVSWQGLWETFKIQSFQESRRPAALLIC